MIEKRVVCLLVLVLFLVSSSIVSGQVDTSGLESGVGTVTDTAEQINDYTDKEKWDYLGEQWKEAFLNNSKISNVDQAFRAVDKSWVFFIFLGQHYDFSLLFLFVFLIWLFFFINFGKIFEMFSSFSKGVSWIVALLISIILAHIKVYSAISVLLFKIIFFREGVWGWVWFVIFILLYVFVLMYIKRVIWVIGRKFKKSKEAKEAWDQKFKTQVWMAKLETASKAADAIIEGLKD